MTKWKAWGGDKHTLQMATRALIYSITDFGSTMYTATNNIKIKSIQIVQNNAQRLSTYALPNTK